MGDKYPKLKVAAVNAAPVFLDREASTEKACQFIREAGANGAKVIAFPEGFIPAHPVWFHFHPGTDNVASRLSLQLLKNSVIIPEKEPAGGPEIAALCQAAKDAGTYVIMGLCEKESLYSGTMYNSQVFISPEGRYMGKHQKIMPTVGERFVHKVGSADTFGAFQTEYGPISGLMCSENFNPLAIFALASEGTMIHAMAWPNHRPINARQPLVENISISAQGFARMTKAYVIASAGSVDERMIKMLEPNERQEQFLRNPANSGGSVIVAPDASIVAGPMGNEEGLLYADVDLENCLKTKLHLDFAGHYNRPDIFQLHINRQTPRLYVQEGNPWGFGADAGCGADNGDSGEGDCSCDDEPGAGGRGKS